MIQQIVKWCLLVIVCLVLQSSLMPSFAIYSVQPDLLMMVLFFIAIRFGIIPGIFTGFFLGLGLDLYSPSLLGQAALSKTIAGFFSGLFNERMMKTEPVIKVVLLFLTFLVHDILFITIELVENNHGFAYLLSNILSHTIPRAFYTSIILFLMYIWDFVIKPSLKR